MSKFYIVKRIKVEEIIVKLDDCDSREDAEMAAEQVSDFSSADEVTTSEVNEDTWETSRRCYDDAVDWSEQQ